MSDSSEHQKKDMIKTRSVPLLEYLLRCMVFWMWVTLVSVILMVALTSCAPYTPPRPKPYPPISGCIALCGSPCPPTVHCEHCTAMVDADEWPVSEAAMDCTDWNDH